MKYLLPLALALLTVGCQKSAPAPEPVPEQKVQKMLSQEEMLAATEPGEEHKKLAQLVGTYEHTVTWWMNPSEPPQVMKGMNENSLSFDGRFLLQKNKGGTKEMPFEGLGITGFDNIKKQFVSLWIDNTSTGVMNAAGIFDPSSNTLIEKGTMSDPMTGNPEQPFRAVWNLGDGSSYGYEMFITDSKGQETKVMQISYQKKKTSRK
jgi:hypothetical protein